MREQGQGLWFCPANSFTLPGIHFSMYNRAAPDESAADFWPRRKVGHPPGSYTSVNGLSTGQQLKYFQNDGMIPPDGSGVGLGNTNLCYIGPGLQGSANGDCSYSAAINKAHGYQ